MAESVYKYVLDNTKSSLRVFSHDVILLQGSNRNEDVTLFEAKQLEIEDGNPFYGVDVADMRRKEKTIGKPSPF